MLFEFIFFAFCLVAFAVYGFIMFNLSCCGVEFQSKHFWLMYVVLMVDIVLHFAQATAKAFIL